MARKKSYTDDDVINTAKIIVDKGLEPSGWRLREVLKRGKTTNLKIDLDRLREEGKIPEVVEKKTEVSINIQSGNQVHTELPVEIQDTFNRLETEFSDALKDVMVKMNSAAYCHHEQLIRTRLKYAENATEAAITAKTIAEEAAVEIENRVRIQVEEGEIQEDTIEELEDRLEELGNEKIDWNATNRQLQEKNLLLSEHLDTEIKSYQALMEKLSSSQEAYIVLDTQSKVVLSEIEILREQLSDLTVNFDFIKEKLVAETTELKSVNKSLEKIENQNTTLRKEHEEMLVSLRIAENKLKASEEQVAELLVKNSAIQMRLPQQQMEA